MGRGGEGVGGNWRGVALTHQATVCKNKTCGQGNGTVFFIHFCLYQKDCGNDKNDICFISDVNLPHFASCYSAEFPLSLIDQNVKVTSCQRHCFLSSGLSRQNIICRSFESIHEYKIPTVCFVPYMLLNVCFYICILHCAVTFV